MSVQPLAHEIRPEDVDVLLRGEMPLGVDEYAAEKAAHTTRLAGRPVRRVRAVVTHLPDPSIPEPFRVEASMDVGHTSVRAVGQGERPREAVDAVVERIERRLVRLTDRWQDRSRWTGPPAPEPGSRPGTVERPVEEREVVRRKTFAVAPQSVEEALADMDVLDHDFYLFVDAASGQDAVVYRREGGGYGAIGLPVDAELPAGVVLRPGPADLDEAAARRRLDDGGERFVFYRDTISRRGHVVYRRYDGHYGLITPA